MKNVVLIGALSLILVFGALIYFPSASIPAPGEGSEISREQFLERGVANTSTFNLELRSPSHANIEILNNGLVLDELTAFQGQYSHPVAPLFFGTNEIRVQTDADDVAFVVMRDDIELCSAKKAMESCVFSGTPAYIFEPVSNVDLSDAKCVDADSAFLEQFFSNAPHKNLQSSFKTFFKVKRAELCTGPATFVATHSAEFFGIPLVGGREFELVFSPNQRVRLLYSEKSGLNEALLLLENSKQRGYLQYKDSRRVKSILWETI